MGGCTECRCRRNYPQDGRTADQNRCTGCDGRKETGIQLSDFGKIVDRFKKSVANDAKRQEAVISYDIDEYDERFLRHLALGYTKEMIANLKGMPFGVKSLEKRQNDLIGRLFPNGERVGVNATRLAVRALELRIIDLDNLEPDEE